MRLKISARKSDLARLQAYMVGEALQSTSPGLEIEYRFKESLGDKNLTDPLWQIPEKGVFTEDFYGELIRGETDMVVHSWKDLPTEGKSDTQIVATLPRADQRDLLLIKKSHLRGIQSSGQLKLYSSSPRREYNLKNFLLRHLPFQMTSISFESVRGNIPTRIRKLIEASDVDGLIVAKAALDRLLSATQEEFKEVQTQLRSALSQFDWMVLPLSINPNAAAQGALAIEIAQSRRDLLPLLEKINHVPTFHCAEKERQILSGFGGGCHQKIGIAVLARPFGEVTFLRGLTDKGQALLDQVLKNGLTVPQFAESQLWSAETQVTRTSLPYEIPVQAEAFFVARAEACPDDLKPREILWTAGVKTWEKLAQKGLWVHGCSDSLGEQEEPALDVLAGKSLKWIKLTHDRGATSDKMQTVATYTLNSNSSVAPSPEKEFFFWNSGSQFLQMVSQFPHLLNKFHACGPGNTYKIISKYLKERDAFDSARIFTFLDQEDWRKQCLK